jgi:hypothetical protein
MLGKPRPVRKRIMSLAECMLREAQSGLFGILKSRRMTVRLCSLAAHGGEAAG